MADRSTVRAKYRGEYRKDLREKVDAESALDEISACENEIKNTWRDLEPAQVGALKTLLDSKWRRVNKVIPDVKSVEHDIGENVENLARDELNARISKLYALAHQRALARGGAGVAVADGGDESTH